MGGGVFLGSQNSKCQVFIGGEGGSWVVKTQSAKFWPSFHWGGGGGKGVFFGSPNENWYSWQNEQNICRAIADSLSHTMCVETNNESLKSD